MVIIVHNGRKKTIVMKNRICKNLLIFSSVIGMFFGSTIQAQEGEELTAMVESRVIDDQDQPVPDVFVMSFATNDRARTAADGTFALKVAASTQDQIVVDVPGYEISINDVQPGGVFSEDAIVLYKSKLIDGDKQVSLPYQSLANHRNVSAVNVISGEELASYPSTSFLEALEGRLPGLTLHIEDYKPGHEAATAYIRGVEASIYVDGIMRDPSDLTIHEIESVQLIKDLSGRTALGISGVNPVIWITTIKGKSYNKQINVSAEYGFSSPSSLPDFLDSYNYASLYNEALKNDDQAPLYSAEDLAAYQDGSDPLYFPNIDYYGTYVKSSTPFRRANINFSGGDKNVNYFSMLDYVGSEGLEAVGEQTKTDRFKLRGNVNIRLNDFIQMNVNLSGTYGKSRFPNQGSGAGSFNMFDILSTYPSNAHAMNFKDSLLLISDDYGVNLENELLHSGHAIGVDLNTQNSATLKIDLNKLVKGLSFIGLASFDIYSNVTTNKGGTAALYRLLPDENVERMVEEVIEPSLYAGYDDFTRRTVANLQFNYDRVFGDHALTMNAVYFQGLVASRTRSTTYQPAKMQDLSFRANYAYNEKYVLQFDLAYSGSMKLPEGQRFSAYPTLGAAWVLSKESFLSSSSVVDFLKLYSSAGIMGNDQFTLPGYNPYYLYQTLWFNAGGWEPGVQGDKGDWVNIYNIQQEGSSEYVLPKRNYINVGTQGELFERALSFQVNYYHQKDYDLISQKSSYTPSIFGTGGFLPATNFGETARWGVDGFVQYSQSIGDFRYSIGGNMSYTRAKYLVVDEPIAEEEYRKLAGKDMDLFWIYEDEGLYQTGDEISDRGITQSWGEVQPGDIRYMNYNDDDVIDEKDIHTTGAHSPRISYAVNLSLKYKGFGLYVLGQGIAAGETMLNNPRYFWINGTSQNYSEVMLDRWPNTNNYPRLTTQSQNNYQGSSYWLANAAYFSVKNVELSYTLPNQMIEKAQMRDCKIFIRGTNLLTLSGLNEHGINPENQYSGTYLYPMYRTFTFGVSCKF